MKKNKKIYQVSAILIVAVVMLLSSCKKEDLNDPNSSTPAGTTDASSRNVNSLVYPATAHMHGAAYSTWTGRWWKWALELPPAANHPFNDDPGFDVTMGQTGNVWYLAGVFGTSTRTCTVPHGNSLLVAIANAEASDLEGLGATYQDRLSTANFFANHIIPSSVFCNIDGSDIQSVSSNYRFVSPEFTFDAPSPWYYGATGGHATSVSDGYFVMIKQLKKGNHTLHFGGSFHFSVAEGDPFDFDASIDQTYHLTIN